MSQADPNPAVAAASAPSPACPSDAIEQAIEVAGLPASWRLEARHALELLARERERVSPRGTPLAAPDAAFSLFLAWVCAAKDDAERYVRLHIALASFWLEFLGPPRQQHERQCCAPPGWPTPPHGPAPEPLGTVEARARMLAQSCAVGGRVSPADSRTLSARLSGAIVAAGLTSGLQSRCRNSVRRYLCFPDRAPGREQNAEGLRHGLTRQQLTWGSLEACVDDLANHLVDRAREWTRLDTLENPAALRLRIVRQWCIDRWRQGGTREPDLDEPPRHEAATTLTATEKLAAQLLEHPRLAGLIPCPTQRAVYALVEFVGLSYSSTDCEVTRVFEMSAVRLTLHDWFSAAAHKMGAAALAEWPNIAFSADDWREVSLVEGPQPVQRTRTWAKTQIQGARCSVRDALQRNPSATGVAGGPNATTGPAQLPRELVLEGNKP